MPTSPSTTPRRAHASRLRACALASLASLAVVAGATSLGAGCGARTGLMVDGVVADANAVTDVSDAEAGADVVTCTPGVITLAKATPAVMFVLDRSGSMADSLGATNGNQSKWTLLANALRATLPTVDDAMQIGALFFPSAGAGGPGGSQCSVPGAPDLSPATGNVQPLLKLMQQTRPNGGTPTADALQVAAARLLGVRAASTARALVLATDGAPDCDASKARAHDA